MFGRIHYLFETEDAEWGDTHIALVCLEVLPLLGTAVIRSTSLVKKRRWMKSGTFELLSPEVILNDK